MSFSETLASVHPAVVHMPLGILTLYAVLELIPIRKMWTDPRWLLAKRVMLFFGTLGIILAVQTGQERGGENIESGSILEFHSRVGTNAAWIFGILAFGQLVMLVSPFFTRKFGKNETLYVIWKVIERIAKFLTMRPVIVVGALFGLAVLTLTGALGGSMVYGPEADPMVSMIYKIFRLN